MPQHVRDQIDIVGLAVEVRAVGAAELVRRNIFDRRDLARILLYQVFYAAYADPLFLKGEEERLLMSGQRNDQFPLIQVIHQRVLDFIAEVDDDFLSAFSVDADAVISEVDVLDIQADALRNTDSCAQHQGHDGQVAHRGLFMAALLRLRHAAAVLDDIQKSGDFVGVQTGDDLFMCFRELNQARRVRADDLLAIKIIIKGAKTGHLAFNAQFLVRAVNDAVLCSAFSRHIIFHIFHEFFQIRGRDPVQIRHGQIFHGLSGKFRDLV